MNRIVYVIILIVLMSSGCSGDVELEEALLQSGKNRVELEKVLSHYQNDKLKYEAARFLIVNMVGAYGYDSKIETACDDFYNKYDSLMRVHSYDSLTHIFDYGKMDVWDRQVDSLWADYSEKNRAKLDYPAVMDLQNISSEYLINEIELAFEAWQKNVYSRLCLFDEFCEYILPYRHRNGLIAESARHELWERHKGRFFENENKELTDEVDSLMCEYSHITHSGFAGMSIPVLSPLAMERLRHGLCEQRCWFNTILLSSLGMASATDFVPAWGNRNNSHTWNVVIKNGESYAFESFWDNDRWKYKRIYNNKECDSVWGRYRLPKVYRHTYRRYIEGPMADENEDIANIPVFFKNERKKDVSKEYFETTDVKLDFKSLDKSVRYVYLCVLNYGSWSPVQWGKVQNGRAVFLEMGKEVLYLPMYCKNGVMLPCGDPIIVNKSGEIEYIEPKKETESIVVSHFSGALAFVKTKTFFEDISGTLLLSDDNDTICKFPKGLELNTVKVESKCDRPTRSVKMLLPHKKVALGRIEFFTLTENGIEKIKNVRIKTLLPVSENGEKASFLLDESSSTGYSCELDRDCIEFDLGGSYQLKEVRFCPYLSSGFSEGVEYELCYWKGKWKHIDKKVGREFISFENVPKGALLAIRPTNNTKRIGFRPFRYINGEVEWW